MTSRDRVFTAFAHQEPDRVPRWCGASPEFMALARRRLGMADSEQLLVRFGDDFRRVWARYAGPDEFSPDHGQSPGATSRSPFGIERHGYGCGMPTSHPLARATLREVEAYPWPDPNWMDVSRMRPEALAWKGRYAILGGDWSPFWHDACDLLGMENLMIKMTDAPEIVDAVRPRRKRGSAQSRERGSRAGRQSGPHEPAFDPVALGGAERRQHSGARCAGWLRAVEGRQGRFA